MPANQDVGTAVVGVDEGDGLEGNEGHVTKSSANAGRHRPPEPAFVCDLVDRPNPRVVGVPFGRCGLQFVASCGARMEPAEPALPRQTRRQRQHFGVDGELAVTTVDLPVVRGDLHLGT